MTISLPERDYYALTRKAFDVLAPFYDVITMPLARVRQQVVEHTGADKGSTILDVATGTGQQAFAFAKRGYDVVGVDITESMLDIARKNNKAGLVEFEAGDATHLRFTDGSFDVACISFALHDMPLTIRKRVLEEMARVTRPNGIILVVDYDLPHSRIGRGLIYRLVTLYESEFYKQFISSDLDALLGEVGLEVVGKHSLLFGAARILKAVRKIKKWKLNVEAR